jgi:hypothetical protein
MKTITRRLIAVGAVAAVIGIPGVASAQGGQSCVGETAKIMHMAFRTLERGGVGDFLGGVRSDPSGFPWCNS